MSAHPRDEAIAFENAFETASEYVDRMMTTEGTMSMAAEFYYDAFYTDWARELDSAAFYHYPAEMSAEEFGFVVFSASVRWWLWIVCFPCVPFFLLRGRSPLRPPK